FTDLSKQKPIKFNIKNINTRVNSITLDKTTPILYGISFDTPKKGNISVDGDVVVEPLKINSKLISEDISFEPYLPYIKEFVNIDLKSGSLSTKLNIKLEEKDDLFEPLVQGDIIVDKIDIFHSLDEQRIFSMDQLKIEDIKFKTDDLNIKNITLDGIYSKFAIASDKTTNLDNIMVANDINSSVKKDDKKSSFKYFIKNIELKNSKTDFSDFSLPLNFETKIDSLSANIKDISSNDSNTKIKLTGIVDKYGMATINGDINTANYKKRTDVKIDFENLDVTSYSPYSGKFIGNKIATGRLWLDLSYKIRDSKLSSTNNMRIKELTLGEVVQSEDAVDLPIGLVIALLEDSDGFIDVDVPVDGDIDNPEFKLSGAIWGAVGNVIKNIITSPFRFLGSLLGIDSDELGSIDFDYGLATLLPPQKEKLDNLSKALHKKHNLALRIEPFYDEVEDLKLFQKEKLVTLIDKKDKSKSIKKLYIKEFGEEEYDKLNSLNKDKNIIDILTQKLIPTIIIEKELLEKLAIKRAKVIKEYLVSKNLDTSRVIISDKINNITLKDMKRVSINLEVDIKKKEEK
ncbi:MAG: DUF748 domain-containing protein, partial [Campylobacterota bacterium]|nr:DUF748 domain-containing protein [Campylobacterota bacterium]